MSAHDLASHHVIDRRPPHSGRNLLPTTVATMGLVFSSGGPPSKVFGGSLEDQMIGSDADIPTLVKECTVHLRRGFSKTPHLFRLPTSRFFLDPPAAGSESYQVERELLRHDPEYVFRKKSIILYTKLCNTERIEAVPFDLITDAHILSGMLEIYFKQLEPPLCTNLLYDNFIRAQKHTSTVAYVVKMRSLVTALPARNRHVLKYMVYFFKELITCGESNGLNVQLISDSFGPIFLRQSMKYKKEHRRRHMGKSPNAHHKMAESEMLKQCILQYDHIFNQSNEEELTRLYKENEELKLVYKDHESILSEANAATKVQVDHRYNVIVTWGNLKRLRTLFQRWKAATEMVSGVSSVYGRLRAAESANDVLREKIKKLENALETAAMHIDIKKSIRPGGLYASTMGQPGKMHVEFEERIN